jgi:IMP dehydrogenase
MIQYNKTALCFDDILLVPQDSSVKSRHDVGLTMIIGEDHKIVLKFPVIAAPMDTVCDIEMCITMGIAGGLGILHRYMSNEVQIDKVKTLKNLDINFGVAIASNNGFMEQTQRLYDVGARIFLIDTANGHGDYAVAAVAELRDNFSDIHIMAGNVATAQGFAKLSAAGADSIRVGIGGGSACTTRLVSGHGVPTLASIMDVEEWREATSIYRTSIIADGGIRNSGDMVKAFAAGADAVMVGSMLAGTDESPGKVISDAQGRPAKEFRGMASAAAQIDATGKVSVPEGVSTTIPYKGSVKTIFDQIRGGLGSGCSYSGVQSLSKLSYVAEYVEATQASLNESRPHAL